MDMLLVDYLPERLKPPEKGPRCDYMPGRMRCVRAPHPDHPTAHIRIAVPLDDNGEGDDHGAEG